MRTNTILVIPFADGIGDFVNVQPLVGALKRRFPQASFTVAASEHGNRLVNDPTVEVVKPSGFNYEPGRMPWTSASIGPPRCPPCPARYTPSTAWPTSWSVSWR